ncbi:MAG: hypothetical protein DHS20C18_54220 [Saprospiraceae bacterium]|nr:MAG: hypothetical protein DHS20C18_54220 [Saprospiraceae bacterium]
MKTQKLYLALTILGFIAPNILVFVESIETGNILLYTNLFATIDGMFANRISTIFMIDLLFAVIVFFIWTFYDSKKNGVKKIGLVWLLTMLLGLAGGFPFYLYLREKTFANNRYKT